jgi:hypothetical protein
MVMTVAVRNVKQSRRPRTRNIKPYLRWPYWKLLCEQLRMVKEHASPGECMLTCGLSSASGIMDCKNTSGLKILSSNTKCSDDAVTKTCVQGLKNQWECWCQNLFAPGWGPGENAGETCGNLFGKVKAYLDD